MHFKDISERVALNMNNKFPQKEVDFILNEFIDTIVKSVADGEEVQLKELGKFYPKYFKGKTLSNSGIKWMNGKAYSIPPRFTLGFTPSRKAKERVALFLEKIKKITNADK